MEGAPEAGLVLVVTWQAYVGLPYAPNEKNFQVIIDEIPQLDRFYAIRSLPQNVEQISKWADIARSRMNTSASRKPVIWINCKDIWKRKTMM